jgi:hypothetical protein
MYKLLVLLIRSITALFPVFLTLGRRPYLRTEYDGNVWTIINSKPEFFGSRLEPDSTSSLDPKSSRIQDHKKRKKGKKFNNLKSLMLVERVGGFFCSSEVILGDDFYF